ncbi:ribonuclease H-like domain-containing protein [Tanacetum coccineum]|uniref:Ribonuclease H-like domain-containing protein n=1 Tax=Tanacetum coccineum TaxID=301880 RepID=A0ABQ4ZZS5_9ASTR
MSVTTVTEKGTLLGNADLEGIKGKDLMVAQDGLGGYDWSNEFKVEPVNYALMAISSSSSSSSSDNEVQKCSKQCLESFKTLQKNYDSEREKHSRVRLEIQGYELALESLESRILVHEKNELAWEKWEESSKNLDELLNSQLSARDKTGLGYGTQLNEISNNSETDSEISLSVFYVRSSDEENIPVNDSFSKVDGFHAVPPPITGKFLTPRADISFAGLDEYAIRKKIIESKITDLNTKTSETVGKTNEANTQKPKTVYESVNRDKVIIEDWNSDDEDDVSEVQTVSPVKTNETQTVKTRVDKIGQTSQKQGIGFKKIKACFVYKSIDHLIKDCNFHDKHSQEPKLKIVVNTGPRVDKPVWDNTKRVNHQKISKYPHLRKTFVLSGVLTRTGLITPIKQNEKRAVHKVGTARPVSTVRPVSTTRPVSTVRPFALKIAQTSGAIRPIYPRMDNVRPRGSYSPIKSQGGFGGLREITWIMSPKTVDHSCSRRLRQSRDLVTGSCNGFRRGTIDKTLFIKKNKSDIMAYLSDYEDYNGGFVAFGSDPNRGKITGKGKIRTANLDFDDVYFVDELKFNLFSVSQMCDKKNSVLFTETECLILSPSFKLLDESQVVLRAPRKDDVYNLGTIKSMFPSRVITCYIANDATADESKLWHRKIEMDKQHQAIGTKWVFKNKRDERSIVVKNKARLIAHGFIQEEGIDYDEVFAPVARIEVIRLFLAFVSYMGFTIYQMDVKSTFLYDTIKEEVHVHQPPGFVDPAHSNKVYKESFLQRRSMCIESERLYDIQRFQIELHGETSLFLGLQVQVNNLMESLFIQDKSMIGSLMYLTASRPDIMFAVCACARFQVTPKASHLNAVKRIFRPVTMEERFLAENQKTGGCQILAQFTMLHTRRPVVSTMFVEMFWMTDNTLKQSTMLVYYCPQFAGKPVSIQKHQLECDFKFNDAAGIDVFTYRNQAIFYTISIDGVGSWRVCRISDRVISMRKDWKEEVFEDKVDAEGVLRRDSEETRVSTKDLVSTDKPKVSTDKLKVSTDKPNEGTTEPNEGTAEPKDGNSDESAAPSIDLQTISNSLNQQRSLLTLKPLPKIDPKDKGKKVLEEKAESDAESDGVNDVERKFAQLANDEEVARKVQEEWESEEEKKKLAGGYKHAQLNKKKFEEIQVMYEKTDFDHEEENQLRTFLKIVHFEEEEKINYEVLGTRADGSFRVDQDLSSEFLGTDDHPILHKADYLTSAKVLCDAGCTFTQRDNFQLYHGGSISPEGFLPSFLLMVIMVMVFIVVDILVVVIVAILVVVSVSMSVVFSFLSSNFSVFDQWLLEHKVESFITVINIWLYVMAFPKFEASKQ